MSDTTPRSVLVTGGGRGIGRAIALRFAEAGALVFVNFFVNREAAEKTAHDVELRGGVPHLLQADLKDEGIPSAVYYPIPLGRQRGYAHFPSAPTPVSDALSKSVVSLPMHRRVCDHSLRISATATSGFKSRVNAGFST